MIFGSSGIIKEVKEQGKIIAKQIQEVNEHIPFQSNLEKEYNKLQDEKIKLEKEVRELSGNLLSLQETNEKLIEYIKNIEEVQESNKFNIEVCETFDSQLNKIKYKIITIPELKLIKKVSDYDEKD